MIRKKPYSAKTLKQKVSALKELEEGMSNKDVAEKYEIPKNTLSTWLKNKKKLIDAYESGSNPRLRRIKAAKYENVDKAILEWFLAERSQSSLISDAVLQQKAVFFALELGVNNFHASYSWLKRWKERNNMSLNSVIEESVSVSSWNDTKLPTLLSNYDLKDVYNSHEFGLFYQALPDKILPLNGEKCLEGKHSKIRLTGIVAANALGEKIPMFVIGKFNEPRCFSNVKRLPCRYRAQQNSRMCNNLFEEWIRELDQKFHCEERNVVFIVDNCVAWQDINNLKAINLVSSPLKTVTQTMNQGIIRSMKAHYRHILVQKIISNLDAKKPVPEFSILDAMNILVTAWSRVSEATVLNCFEKAGITEISQTAMGDDCNPFKYLEKELEQLRERNSELAPESVDAYAFVDFDAEVINNEVLLTDKDISPELTESSSDDDFYDDPIIQPNKKDVFTALKVLQNYSLFCEDSKVHDTVMLLSTSVHKEQISHC